MIYREDLPSTAREVVFRILLFKLFNRVETWELLEDTHGPVLEADFEPRQWSRTLEAALTGR